MFSQRSVYSLLCFDCRHDEIAVVVFAWQRTPVSCSISCWYRRIFTSMAKGCICDTGSETGYVMLLELHLTSVTDSEQTRCLFWTCFESENKNWINLCPVVFKHSVFISNFFFNKPCCYVCHEWTEIVKKSIKVVIEEVSCLQLHNWY